MMTVDDLQDDGVHPFHVLPGGAGASRDEVWVAGLVVVALLWLVIFRKQFRGVVPV